MDFSTLYVLKRFLVSVGCPPTDTEQVRPSGVRWGQPNRSGEVNRRQQVRPSGVRWGQPNRSGVCI